MTPEERAELESMLEPEGWEPPEELSAGQVLALAASPGDRGADVLGPWVDRHGDVWTLGDDGLLWTPETRPFPREHVEKKWGPLKPVDTHPRAPR